jgi:hypothetical protein
MNLELYLSTPRSLSLTMAWGRIYLRTHKYMNLISPGPKNFIITYYWTGLLILDHSYLVGNLTNSKIAETKALEPLKS